jgi:hypothetical protein
VYLLSDDAELVEGKYTKEGDIAADFRLEANIPLVFTVTFGKKEKFLPISTLSKIQLGGRWIPSKYTEVSWDHRDKFSLPEKVKVTQFPLSQRSPKIFLEVDFNWLIGPEVTEKIDPDLSDWRKPFRTLFDVDWQLAGGRKPAAN